MADSTTQIAIVTGANKGLGFSIVKGLCEKFKGIVYLTARDESRGKKAVERLNEIGLKPAFHQLDVEDRNSVHEFGNYLKTKHGKIDVLINNAAILEWDQVYPTYEAAKRNIDINYKSLLTIEEFLLPLMRDGGKVINVSSACGHLSNLKNKKWIQILSSPDLTLEQLNSFVDDYLASVKNGTFNRNDFADDGKHAEHRVSKIAVTALTFIWQRKYENLQINAVNPGHIKTDMAHGGGVLTPDEAAKLILYLVFEASPNLKGVMLWEDKKIVDWIDFDATHFCTGFW